MTNSNMTEKARLEFCEFVRSVGGDPIADENAALSIGREFLPTFAAAVLDGGNGTAEYYEWLLAGSMEAQNEHDAEVAAGHEWHE